MEASLDSRTHADLWGIVAGRFYSKYMNCKLGYNDPIMRYHYGYELLQYKEYYYQMYLAAMERAGSWRTW